MLESNQLQKTRKEDVHGRPHRKAEVRDPAKPVRTMPGRKNVQMP